MRSVRQGRKVVQEVVAHLGELDEAGRAQAAALARSLTGASEQRDLFVASAEATPPVPVHLDRVRVERSRRFGEVWLGWTLWRVLGLEAFCETAMPRGRADVAWSTMAAILVIARLCEPSSELHIAEDWYRKTALEDLLGVAPDQVNDDRLYRALDKLLPHKAALETHLKARLGELFALDYDLMLYDVTSTYWHQKTARVLAHIFVCFLAYVLWKTLEQWQTRAGLGNSPRTILEELGAIQSTDVVLPIATVPPRERRLRCVVRPDKAQAALFDRLGLRLPDRLRIPVPIPEV